MREKEKEEKEGKIWRKMSKRFGREKGRKIKLENGKSKGNLERRMRPANFLGVSECQGILYTFPSSLTWPYKATGPPPPLPTCQPLPLRKPHYPPSLSKNSKHKEIFKVITLMKCFEMSLKMT
jgi:hypothetical protein